MDGDTALVDDSNAPTNERGFVKLYPVPTSRPPPESARHAENESTENPRRHPTAEASKTVGEQSLEAGVAPFTEVRFSVFPHECE